MNVSICINCELTGESCPDHSVYVIGIFGWSRSNASSKGKHSDRFIKLLHLTLEKIGVGRRIVTDDTSIHNKLLLTVRVYISLWCKVKGCSTGATNCNSSLNVVNIWLVFGEVLGVESGLLRIELIGYKHNFIRKSIFYMSCW